MKTEVLAVHKNHKILTIDPEKKIPKRMGFTGTQLSWSNHVATWAKTLSASRQSSRAKNQQLAASQAPTTKL